MEISEQNGNDGQFGFACWDQNLSAKTENGLIYKERTLELCREGSKVFKISSLLNFLMGDVY